MLIELIGFGVAVTCVRDGDAAQFEVSGTDPSYQDNILRVDGVDYPVTAVKTEICREVSATAERGFVMKGLFFKGKVDLAGEAFDINKLLFKATKICTHESEDVVVVSVWYDGKEIECIDTDTRIESDLCYSSASEERNGEGQIADAETMSGEDFLGV